MPNNTTFGIDVPLASSQSVGGAEESIRAYLFGSFSLFRGEVQLPVPGTANARSLLAYLLLHRQTPHPRLALAGLFWPDMPEGRARRSLTQALWQIRRVLPGIVQADADAVHIHPDAPIWVDVVAFEELIAPYLTACSGISPDSGQAAQSLRQALQLYRGDLLEGFYDEWLLLERERLREKYLQVLECLIQLEKSALRYEQALEFALRLVQADRLRESAHREVMRLYVVLDRPEAALKQLEKCRKTLAEELGVTPESETVALANEIARRLEQSISQTSVPYLPWSASTVPFKSAQPMQIPLVGRDTERRELILHVEGIFNELGGVVLVEGEAGVGKSRLMQEIARDAEWRGAQTLWGGGWELGVVTPYGPLIEALAGGLSMLRVGQLTQVVDTVWLQILYPLLPVLASARLDLAPPLPISPVQERTRLVEALDQLLRGWEQIIPLVILLEDLQWADADTLDVLITLAPRLREHRVLVMGTFRSEDARSQPLIWEKIQSLDRAGVSYRLRLSRLDAVATGELVRRSLGLGRPAPFFENRLYRETEGNPLFVLETLRDLYDEGVLRRDERGDWSTPWDATTADYAELPLPKVVERVITRRLIWLNQDERAVLNSAVVLGSDFDFQLLMVCLEGEMVKDVLLRALAGLIQRRFLEETPNAYRVSHDKIRQVVYQAMDSPARQKLHLRAGEVLETMCPDRISAIAHHYFRGCVWEKAIEYCQRAGDQAAKVYANQDAIAHYTRAVEALKQLPTDAPRIFTLRLSREAALSLIGDRITQAEDLAALEDLLDDPMLDTLPNRATVTLRRAAYWEATSDYPQALRSAEKAVELACAAGDEKAEYQAHMQWGRLSRQRGDFASAQEHFERMYVLAKLLDDRSAQANSLRDWGAVFFELGDYGTALEHHQRALAICPPDDPVTLASIHGGLGSVFHYLADYSASLFHEQKALALRRAVGDRRLEASTLYNISTVLHDSGDNEAARCTLEQVCELTHSIGDKRLEGYGWVYLALTLEYDGRYDEARTAYTKGLALRREVGLNALAIDALAGLARVASAQGDHTQAVRYANEVLTWLEERGPNGVGDACLAYLGAYRAMLVAGQRERGEAGLRAAYKLLMMYADSIKDAERRRAYIHDISPGKHIWEDYQALVSRRVHMRLPRADVPLGRPVRADEWVEVNWTVEAPQDEEIPGKVDRRRSRLLRLLEEAQAQGAAPTYEHLAEALQAGLRTIERDMAILRHSHPDLPPTRRKLAG